MERKTFDEILKAHSLVIEEIKSAAWALHESVGQTYDKSLPYGVHLSMVADAVILYITK